MVLGKERFSRNGEARPPRIAVPTARATAIINPKIVAHTRDRLMVGDPQHVTPCSPVPASRIVPLPYVRANSGSPVTRPVIVPSPAVRAIYGFNRCAQGGGSVSSSRYPQSSPR